MLSKRANVTLADAEAELRELEADYKTRGAALRALIRVLKAEQPVAPGLRAKAAEEHKET